eukprot:1666857-Pleurochrysis_carterae.AAC.1
MRGLTERVKANQYKRERKGETYEIKRLRLAKGDHGTRTVLELPEQRPGGENGSCQHIKRTRRLGNS